MPHAKEVRRSIDVPSRVITRSDNLEGSEETEITANIHVPSEGWWGWVVVAASFTTILVLDGVAFTFGSLLGDISNDLQVSVSLVALINSIAVALYLILGPLVSALINRFGFRACTMSGSVICAFSLCLSSLITNYASLLIFYGVFAGFGYSLINMSSGLVVGFHFEKLRSMAMAIATCGSSVGVMVCYPLNAYLVKLSGWRSTTLLHSGLFGMVYFFAMTFRPLIVLNVVLTTTEQPSRTVVFLPSTSGLKPTQSRTGQTQQLKPSVTERMFNAVQNANFPTAAAVVEEVGLSGRPESPIQAGPSTARAGPSGTPQSAGASKLTITALTPRGGMSEGQLKQVQSIMSRSSIRGDRRRSVDISVLPSPKRRTLWERLCCWEEHVTESRPMYRDDAFYTGKIENLQEYRKSRTTVAEGEETGLEYQLAVSRAAAASDMREHRGVFTMAVRRVLATMMDPKLLKRKSFLMMCCSGFLSYVGFLVPYVFIQDRNLKAGISSIHCKFFVSAIGASNAVGRLCLGFLAVKIDPLKLFSIASCIAGLSTVASTLSYNLMYQYGYCVVFGFCIAGIACLRSMVLVSLYGLDKLTNATGMILMFQGVGSLISTPLASVIHQYLGYTVAFSVAGVFIALGGLIIIPVKSTSIKENVEILKKSSSSTVPLPKKETMPNETGHKAHNRPLPSKNRAK